jgi:hypothetical protein
MSESGDYNPGPWSGYDFKSARAAYDVHVGRSYVDAVATGKKRKDLVAKTLSTDSDAPLVIACDVTGSMGEWPATIFSKLPYLDLEGKEYLGKGMEISFAAVGDAYSDQYPLQTRPFVTGKGLEKQLKELIIEGNGGGQTSESYDICALYYARNVKMPNAVNPIFIFIGDEGLYDFVDKEQARDWVGTSIEGRLSSKQALEELKKKYAVYLIRKPYGTSSGDNTSGDNKRIHAQWESYLGADHIAILPEAGRVVDVIFGILAKETDRVKYFAEELKGRQKPDQVKTVLKSLVTVHCLDGKKPLPQLAAGYSVMSKKASGKDASSLL